eukprot:COSAG06_NODE_27462_length_592_cov_8.166329_2_plen_65_part_00
MYCAGLGWAGLGWAGLGWAGGGRTAHVEEQSEPDSAASERMQLTAMLRSIVTLDLNLRVLILLP